MAARSEIVLPGHRAFWWSFALLVPVLPFAVLVHVWDNWQEWRLGNLREPIEATINVPVRYAGAEWTLSRFTRLVGQDPASMIVLAEFEAKPDQVAALADAPCQIRVLDRTGRAWKPAVMADPAVRKAAPEAAEKPLCGGPAFAGLLQGQTARMAASFTIPRAAEGVALEIDITTARPAVLVFQD